jgi:hypothetical protein
MSEKCPKCGALRVPQTHVDYFLYECNSVCERNTLDTSFRQSHNCRIAELEAEVERLKEEHSLAHKCSMRAIGDTARERDKAEAKPSEAERLLRGLVEMLIGDPPDCQSSELADLAIAIELHSQKLQAIVDKLPKTVEVERLRAEWQATCDLLGEGYAGEWDLPDEKRRPLDSLVSEVLAQRDEEVERLQKGLDSAVKTARQRDKAIARVWDALGCTIDLNITVWDQVAELQTIANALPKCWGLKDGKRVRDVPVVPGKTMWRIKSDGQAIRIKVSSVSAQYVFSGSIPFSPEQLSDTREAAEYTAKAAGGE